MSVELEPAELGFRRVYQVNDSCPLAIDTLQAPSPMKYLKSYAFTTQTRNLCCSR